MIIKNIDRNDIEVAYEGTTYIFPMKQIVQVDDEVGKFTVEKYPLSFSKGSQLKAADAKPVETYKTKVYMATQQLQREEPMVNSEPAITQIDNSDQSWYGDGIQSDTAN